MDVGGFLSLPYFDTSFDDNIPVAEVFFQFELYKINKTYVKRRNKETFTTFNRRSK